MGSLIDVCFAGQLLEGQELQNVRQKVQKLFNANPETLDKLFSGKTQVLKRGCDQATATKYQQALERAGAVAILRPCEPKPAQASTDNSGLDLAATGEDILRPDERAAPVTTEVDTSGIELTAAGTDLSDHEESTAAAPDTGHLSMGDVGDDIPNLADTRAQLHPNTDNISLSPEGTDFSDCAPPEADTPALDLSNIEVAPVGSDVLEEQFKKIDTAKGPDTGHISLED